MENSSFFNRTLKLFDGILFEKVFEEGSFKYLQSYFKSPFWNWIIPNNSVKELEKNKVEKRIKQEEDSSREISFYISEELNDEYSEYLTKNGYTLSATDVYLYKKMEESYDTNEDDFELLDESKVEEQIKLAELCFPKFENKEYTELFEFNHKPNFKDKFFYNVLRYNKGTAVAFGFVIVDKDNNLAYLHNAGTHPDYRRKGYFTEIVKYRCNLALMNGIDEIFAIVEEEDASYKGLKNLGFEEKMKFYIYSK